MSLLYINAEPDESAQIYQVEFIILLKSATPWW